METGGRQREEEEKCKEMDGEEEEGGVTDDI